MPFWRRRKKALHVELAEGTGLLDWKSGGPAPVVPPSATGTLDVLHGGRPRRWDAVAAAEAPGLPGDTLDFTALADGTLLVDEDLPAEVMAPLTAAVEESVALPYRARAVRREGDLWAVAANAIEVVELAEDVPGDRVNLAMQDGERTLLVDEQPAWESIPTLEARGAASHANFVLNAERLDGNLWAVEVNPL